MNLLAQLYKDEAGFIVSAELVLIATIAVLGMIVGLSELSVNINNELEDVGSAFQSVQQSFHTSGTRGHKGNAFGSTFRDHKDRCAGECDVK